eukprot:1197064-Prymnesium_polylepis.1
MSTPSARSCALIESAVAQSFCLRASSRTASTRLISAAFPPGGPMPSRARACGTGGTCGTDASIMCAMPGCVAAGGSMGGAGPVAMSPNKPSRPSL